MPVIHVRVGAAASRLLEVADGMTLLEVARGFALPIEGLCGGVMDCSTCHVVLDAASYATLPPPVEDEEDMLDLIPDCTPTSRLGCQVRVTAAQDGMQVWMRAPE
jgi:ferredoxin